MYAIQSEANTSAVASQLTLSGQCGYELNNHRIIITLGEIANHRDLGNVSGTLAIELWALEQPYSGDGFNGVALSGTSIGELLGQHALKGCRYDLLFHEPPAGTWYLTLMLREWTATGYVTRDYVNFSLPYVVDSKPTVIRRETDNVINVEFPSHKKSSAVTVETSIALPEGSLSAIEASAPGQPQPQFEAAISLNTASFDEIAALKGIPKKVAENIVAARPYESLDEVLKVKGMGAKLLDKVRKFIRL